MSNCPHPEVISVEDYDAYFAYQIIQNETGLDENRIDYIYDLFIDIYRDAFMTNKEWLVAFRTFVTWAEIFDKCKQKLC